MRLVLLPTLSIADYNRDSDYYWFHNFAKTAVANGHFVYFMLPQECEEFFTGDEDGIKYIFFEDTLGFYYRMKYIPPTMTKLFSHGDGYYFADALVTSRTIVAPAMAAMLSDRHEKYFPVINFEQIVREGFNQGLSGLQQAICYGKLPSWFCSENERSTAYKLARSNQVGIIKNDIVVGCGIDVDKLDTQINDKKYPDFTVFYGGRINEDKNFEMVAQVMEYMYKSGKNIKFIITTPHDRRGFIDQYVERLDFVEFHFDTPRALFYQIASKAHVFICTSNRESYSLGFSEQLYLIGLSIFPNKEWAYSCYGDNTLYADSVAEYATLLLDMQKNYKQYAKKIPEVREYMRAEHNQSINYQKVLEFVIDGIPKYDAEKYGSKIDLEKTLAMMSPEFNFRTFLANLPPILSSIAQGSGRQGILGYSPYGMYRMMLNSNIMSDDYKTEHPTMRRVM